MTRVRTNEPIRNLMTPSPSTVAPHTKISEAAARFAELDVHHLPVTVGDTLVGMFSQSDLLRLDYSAALNQDRRTVLAQLDATKTIKDVMSTKLVTVSESDTVRDTARKLCEGRFHALPVVGKENALLGIVTTSDLLRHLAEI